MRGLRIADQKIRRFSYQKKKKMMMMQGSLRADALRELLNEQLEPIASLSNEKRIELWSDVQTAWQLYEFYHPGKNEKAPHQLLQRWKQIQAANEKLLNLVYDLSNEIACEFDRLNKRWVVCVPNLEEISEDKPCWLAEKIKDLFHGNITLPSDLAMEKIEKIQLALCSLKVLSENAIASENKNKDSTRKHNRLRFVFIEAVSMVYKKHFGEEPTTYRDGAWCLFLSRILTIWEKQETTADTAYKTWLEVNKVLTAA
jgi:hypothetical protein